jgi:hypothetical protein
MMTNKEAIDALNESKTDLLQTLSAFTPEQLNTIPFAGSWTAGQVTEHLLKSSSGVPGVLRGDTQATDRPADALTGTISDVFLDYSTKMQSPEFILPSEGRHDKETLLSSMKDAMDEIASQANSGDLTTLCLAFPFPEMGELTGLEWLHFVTCHTKRHTQQIKNIYRTLTETAVS